MYRNSYAGEERSVWEQVRINGTFKQSCYKPDRLDELVGFRLERLSLSRIMLMLRRASKGDVIRF